MFFEVFLISDTYSYIHDTKICCIVLISENHKKKLLGTERSNTMTEAGSDTGIPPIIDDREEQTHTSVQNATDFSYSAIISHIYDRIRDKELEFILIVVSSELTASKIKKKILDRLNMGECVLFAEDLKQKSKKKKKFVDFELMRDLGREYFSMRLSDYPRVIMTKDLKYAMNLIEAANNTTSSSQMCLFYQFHDKNGLVDTDMSILEPLQRCINVIQFKIKANQKNRQNGSDAALNNIADISALLRTKFPRSNSFFGTCMSCCKYTFVIIMFAMFLMTVLNIVLRKKYHIPM